MNEQPGSYGLELRNGMETVRIRDGKKSDPGRKKVGSGINIPDPPHCMKGTYLE
jgi:hypothetical protein